MNRCINIDWLEFYCLEPQDYRGRGILTQEFFAERGCTIYNRGYGTPLYNEMFSIATEDCPHLPFLEIRRNPRTDSNGNCIIHLASCHLRLTNIFCYTETPIVSLCNFMIEVGYIFKSIKRIDIALDFNFFDNGENPLYVIQQYIDGKISKINQSKVSAHGADAWDGRFWNSFKWGSPTSNVNTKLYNKTLEMKQSKPKTYIQDVWKGAGLDLSRDVWRVEFSIKAGNKGFKNSKTQEFYKMQPSQFATREKLLSVFHVLAHHYFHFKYREKNADGTFKRKDRCKSKKLFNIALNETIYKIAIPKGLPDISRMDKVVMKKCYAMANSEFLDDNTRDAARVVADSIAERLYGYVL